MPWGSTSVWGLERSHSPHPGRTARLMGPAVGAGTGVPRSSPRALGERPVAWHAGCRAGPLVRLRERLREGAPEPRTGRKLWPCAGGRPLGVRP